MLLWGAFVSPLPICREFPLEILRTSNGSSYDRQSCCGANRLLGVPEGGTPREFAAIRLLVAAREVDIVAIRFVLVLVASRKSIEV